MSEQEGGVWDAHAAIGLDAGELIVDGKRYDYLAIAVRPAAVSGGLTRSERDVARRAALGESARQIAAARGSSTRTVANQLASVFRKLGVGSRSELAAVAFAGDETP